MDKTKKTYETPELIVVKICTERGYSASSGTEFNQLFMWDNSEDTRQVENYTEANGWTSGSDHFWE